MHSYLKIFIFLIMSFSYLTAGDLLSVGTKAPDFALPDANGKIHKLSDYQGKKVVIYFYPKDGSPGCTKEACNLRDNYDVLKDKGLIILGISYDDEKSHQNFIKEHQLPFTLLSDTDKKVADLYGAKGGLLGFIGAKRITYLIDESGKVLHVFDDVDTGAHAEQILDVLNNMPESKKGSEESDSTKIE
ncbi:MAG: thioredoxin-dependent thiol peroxidase [Calditrichaceae bacterium]|jgi:peroxiredoxin Q/BCP